LSFSYLWLGYSRESSFLSRN